MTFRDDHEAALARAEALERQLAEAREKADEAAAEAMAAHAEKARLEDELADLRDVQRERTARDLEQQRTAHDLQQRRTAHDPQHGRTADRAASAAATSPPRERDLAAPAQRELVAPPVGSYLQPPTEALPGNVEPEPEPFAAGQLGLVIALLLAVLLLAIYASP